MSRVTTNSTTVFASAPSSGTTGTAATTELYNGSWRRRALSSTRSWSQVSPAVIVSSSRIARSDVTMWKWLKNSMNEPPSANTFSL